MLASYRSASVSGVFLFQGGGEVPGATGMGSGGLRAFRSSSYSILTLPFPVVVHAIVICVLLPTTLYLSFHPLFLGYGRGHTIIR